MKSVVIPKGLLLTEEEAFALLDLVMTSTQKMDADMERAVKKLASYCSQSFNSHHTHISELEGAG
jgi:hypothetical protein